MQHPDAASAFQSALRSLPDCERLLPRAAFVLEAIACWAADDRVLSEVEGDLQPPPAEQEGGDDPAGAGEDGGVEQGGPDITQARCSLHLRRRLPGCSCSCLAFLGGLACRVCAPPLLPPPHQQATFLPVVQLFEGLHRMLGALSSLDAMLGSACTTVVSLPPLTRAVSFGARVAELLAQMRRAVDVSRLTAPGDPLQLEQVRPSLPLASCCHRPCLSQLPCLPFGVCCCGRHHAGKAHSTTHPATGARRRRRASRPSTTAPRRPSPS
jgi:hypothetical protein